METDIEEKTWQPLLVIVSKRIECDCGAKAIFIQLDDFETADGQRDYGYVAWCQDCWKRETEGENA